LAPELDAVLLQARRLPAGIRLGGDGHGNHAGARMYRTAGALPSENAALWRKVFRSFHSIVPAVCCVFEHTRRFHALDFVDNPFEIALQRS